MARGWESKSVAEDQAERRASRVERAAVAPEDLALRKRRLALELSRARVAAALAEAPPEPRRAALESALEQLDGELAALAAGDPNADPGKPRHGS